METTKNTTNNVETSEKTQNPNSETLANETSDNVTSLVDLTEEPKEVKEPNQLTV